MVPSEKALTAFLRAVSNVKQNFLNSLNKPRLLKCLFQYGFANAASSLAALIVSPFGGPLAQKLGANLVFSASSFIEALSGAVFGCVTFISGVDDFLALSCILRIIIGITDSLASITIQSILVALYPKRVASIMAAGESIFGAGYALGKSAA